MKSFKYSYTYIMITDIMSSFSNHSYGKDILQFLGQGIVEMDMSKLVPLTN